MKSKSVTAMSFAFSLAAFGPLCVLSSAPVAAADHESQCFNEVQGKIPWDGKEKLNWDSENVKQLCKGTTNPSEPGKCFLSLSSSHVKGQVSWGQSTNWEWRNIINLCAGTNDGAKTVECFNNGIKTGADWRDVILTCQRNS